LFDQERILIGVIFLKERAFFTFATTRHEPGAYKLRPAPDPQRELTVPFDLANRQGADGYGLPRGSGRVPSEGAGAG